ncbi:MAG: Efflux transporter, RND family, MFP subunit [Candidatus Daviesbacteria bacterium GW2011_GWA1_36_8]|uniref:Efflux transporter, RND family, MFP subunit n=1 Tax=Candidatus Daviesbacteria bacterium GW2011_GWA1_36_8 TaxID=1618417 RepID=A0A0G0FB33_9BACT|nr:MAG: Efflux transporter, RND family, MFP subunit [Candidatus Daviesbacteria bacterium GW2011_GWA1_36_8]
MKISKILKLKKFKNPLKRFKFKRRSLIILTLIILIIFGVDYFTIGNKKPAQIEYTKVERTDIKSTVSTSGVLTGKDTANLKFKTGGKLSYLNVKQGDRVYEGQIIAGLDSQDLAINLQQAQNTYRARQADVDKILDDIHLFQYGNGGFGNVGTKNETMTQRQLRTDSEVLMDNAFDNLKQAQRAFQDTAIVSPIDGLITQASFLPNQFVSPADLITSVVNDNEIFFDAEVDESDISKIQLGQNAEVSLNAYPDKIFKGEVAEILPNTKTTTSGSTIVITRIRLLENDLRFTSGLNGQASIIETEVKNALTLPQDAVREDNTVYIKEGNQFKLVTITPGLKSDTEVEVKEGLSENQEVVTNPSSVPQPSGNFLTNFFRRQ